MKFLDAQRLAARPVSHVPPAEAKMLPPHANKMLPPHHLTKAAQTDEASNGPGEPSDEVRALAASLGVDVTTVTGTGKGGRLLLRDIRAAAATLAPPIAPSPGGVES